ncbi:MAG: type III-B CRISPR module RAMP protein Cmr1 [Ignavibacteria bacterium GWB2_35_6b]|nr:MAG: type III-B CRISPR module RAMP protein Cmr1 [Ignavibacteria bacterium GWB2_35_6b]
MANIEKISFDIETITPMFLAGADGKTAELRPASLKGLLRYWWRALQADGDLNRLRDNESGIFGSIDRGGSFSIQIKHESFRITRTKFANYPVPVEGKTFKINILEYLAYGTLEYEKGEGNYFTRDYIQPNSRFKVIVSCFNEECMKEILKTFYVFGLFGGLGSRNRNGFGGFDISNKTIVFEAIKSDFSIDTPYTKENLIKLIKNISTQPYSSFSEQTKLFRSKKPFDSWDKALANVGIIYKQIRSKLEKRHSFEKRQYIGSPIVEKKGTKSFLERHAKPYFIKISKESGNYHAYILYLPSRYCDGLDLDISDKKINHSKVDNDFNNVCVEFNKHLNSEMELVL